ncbi:MAG TPA: ABC transporter permease [Xanthobacteraceae bacterium]|nr:ABC transporter permease [Xanthobacteraceae bacterium]
MTDAAMTTEADHDAPTTEMSGGPPPGRRSIVPRDTIAGRALVAVIAIMTFLAALTLGAVVLVRATATEWQSEVAREVTIQVRPAPGRDIEADIKTAAGIAAAQPGVAGVRPYSKTETARLLEPWLGTGLTFDDLPVPRLIVVRIASDSAPDLAQLAKAVAAQVPGATVDDHRGWIDRMRAMARTSVAVGVGVMVLVLVATMLSVTFATGGAMAANRSIIEVLHFVGAKDGFIAGQFQRHFLLLGLTGGIIGGAAAMLLFLVAGFLGDRFKGTAGEDQVAALFGSFSIGIVGYGAIVGLVVIIAVVTAGASRLTVHRTLASIE